MRKFKQYLGIALIFIFLIIPLPTRAVSDIYSPDNSVKPDLLQTDKITQGRISAGEFSGAAVYDYSLTLPAGRNGMTPSVNLSYNSHDSSLDNIVGYRWSLNLYSIKRFNKRGVEKMYAVTDFTANTPIGGGELISIQTNGQYGVFGEKNERSFTKYEYMENGSWVVTDKQGTKYTFGGDSDSRQFDPADQNRIYQWMLSEIRDRNDNFVRYMYLKSDNQIYPKSIFYIGHGTTDGIFEIRFLPFAQNQTGGKRQDSHLSYAEGFRVETNYLVTGIEVYADNKLRRKYDISYMSVYPITKQTIAGITETGYDANGKATSLPPTTFEYTPSSVSWEETTDYLFPGLFWVCYYNCESWGGAEWDMNGDGLEDFEMAGGGVGGYGSTRYTNNGKNGWTIGTGTYIGLYRRTIPTIFEKALDFDGDARTDVINSGLYNYDGNVTLQSSVQLNGRGYFNNTLALGMGSYEYGKNDNGVSIADLNGDGLPDMIQSRAHLESGNRNDVRYTETKTCLNTDGNYCVATDKWLSPIPFISDNTDYQMPRTNYVQDCNNDGLADINAGSVYGSYINDGNGGWVQNATQCSMPTIDSLTWRSFDANSDGLVDQVVSETVITYGGQYENNRLNLNTGKGFQAYSNIFPLSLGVSQSGSFSDGGVRISDVNGDGLPDIIKAVQTGDTRTGQQTIVKRTFLNRGSKPYFLKTVHTSEGARIDMEYKTSAQYLRADGSQANPNLPVILTTVSKMKIDDGMGKISSTDYFYEDGHYYYKSAYDHEIAGFRVVTKTDGLGYKTKTFYHQGENSIADVSNGEFDDHISKKGMPYRVEIYDNQNHLVKVTINKFDRQDLGNVRFFPYLKQSVTVDYNPESGLNKATAQTYEYDGFGNPIAVTDFGEVRLNSNDGQYADVGNDLIKQQNSFTQNQTDYLVGLPTEQKSYDQNNRLISDQKIFYDNLSFGQAVIGNLTETDVWDDSTNNFVTNRVEYNEYGMPVKKINPRGYATTVTYNADYLYPQSQTNQLGHVTTFDFDNATGNLLQTSDPNGAMSKNEYDGVGRLIKTDVTNPKTNSFATIKTISYNDNAMPYSVHQTTYNDDDVAIDSYAYIDGLGRQIESKSENANYNWTTTASVFDERGNVTKMLQPHFSGNPNFEQIDTNRIGTNFSYDALNRATSITNPLGTTTTSHDVWNKTITDADGNKKDFAFDSRGHLTSVIEHNDDGNYTTLYEYDTPGNLIKITDTLGNIRNFTYDTLGRMLSQTDAYKPSGKHGMWKYEYNTNGNVTKKTDPLNKIVTYSYDALDRVTNEDYQGSDNVEFSLVYDQGMNGIGRLTNVSGKNYIHNINYDQLGRIVTDEKQIDDKDFIFRYDYDLMGGVTNMTYPDGASFNYSYDNAHQLNKIYDANRTFADQFSYTPIGQMEQIRLGEKIVTINNYDPNQMYRLTNKKSATDTTIGLQDYSYQYDPVGNLMKLYDNVAADTAKTVDYQYDKIYRLTGANYSNTANKQDVTFSYRYDPIGNMTYKSDVGEYEYAGNSPHAVTKAGEHLYEYDLSGNMVKRDGNGMVYDYNNQMIQSGNTFYKYDEGGQRIKKFDGATGNSKYYPNKYYEIGNDKEDKYIFAGKLKIAKIEKKIVTVTPVDPVIPPPSNPPAVAPVSSGGEGVEAEVEAEVLPLRSAHHPFLRRCPKLP